MDPHAEAEQRKWRPSETTKGCAYIVFLVALLQLGDPVTDWMVIFFYIIVFWMLTLRRSESDGKLHRFATLTLTAFITMQMTWLGTFVGKWTGSSFMTVFVGVLLFFAVWMFVGPMIRLSRWLVDKGWGWSLPVVFTLFEVIRSYVPVLAFPWALAANHFVHYLPLIQHAAYGSIYLVSLSVYMLAYGIAQFETKGGKWNLGIALGLFAISIGRFLLVPVQPIGKVVALGQPGIDFAYGNPAEKNAQIYQAVKGHYAAAQRAKAELLVLPEGVCFVPQMPPMPPFAVLDSPALLFGGQRGSKPSYQTAFAYDGKDWSYADKTRLVVFGEFVPGRDWIPYPPSFQLPGGDLTASDKLTTLNINGMKVGPVLCFEALFPDISYRQRAQGADFLAIMSIDDWYMGTPAPERLRQAAIWRAIENHCPVVRVGSLGRTCAINEKGDIIKELPLNGFGTLVVDL